MILVDANLLLYAYDSTSEQHAAARRWLEQALSGPEPVCLTWLGILAFLRIATHPTALRKPMTVIHCASLVSEWLQQPVVRVLWPTERHWEVLKELLVEAQAKGPLAMDAHLAALAIEHGATICTRDRDFRRFRGLRLLDPIESKE